MKVLRQVCGEDAWMSETERKLMGKCRRGLELQLAERGVTDSYLLALRVNDLLVSHLLVRRAERALGEEAPEEGAPRAATPAAVLDMVGKARERLRKSVKDLEDYCERTGKPVHMSLPDAVRPLMLKARAILEATEGQMEEVEEEEAEA